MHIRCIILCVRYIITCISIFLSVYVCKWKRWTEARFLFSPGVFFFFFFFFFLWLWSFCFFGHMPVGEFFSTMYEDIWGGAQLLLILRNWNLVKVIVLPDMKYSRVHKLFWYTNTIGKKINSAFSLELPHFELEFDNFCGHYIVETYLFQLWKWILIFLYSLISNIAPETNRKLRKEVFVKLF